MPVRARPLLLCACAGAAVKFESRLPCFFMI
jgi:hypothetical protein